MPSLPEPALLRMSCTHLEDRAAIGAAAAGFARTLGFEERACWEIGISVQELVSNLVRHAGGGELELHAGAGYLEIIATDAGPGIPAAVLAASATSQHGLGALHRLMHELQFDAVTPHGTRIRARRFRDRRP